MLFRSSYWRMLLRADTWREAGLSLRRAHKDKRARKHLRAVAVLALAPVLCLLYLLWLVGTRAIYLAPFVIPIIWWRSRRARQDANPPSILPARAATVPELSPAALARVREYFADSALFLAVMVDRAGSESFLKHKELPEGMSVTSRRVHLDLLKEHNLWDRMYPEDRLALLASDGHWEWDHIHRSATGLEPLRLLRWLLRVDFYLPVIGQQLKGDYAVAHELTQDPAKLRATQSMAEWSSLVTARDAARIFYFRCLAETIHRGLFVPKDESVTKWARELRQNVAGRESEDLVLGSVLVSAAPDDLLGWATSLAEQRTRFLEWVMSILESGEIPANLPRVLPADAAASPHEQEPAEPVQDEAIEIA